MRIKSLKMFSFQTAVSLLVILNCSPLVAANSPRKLTMDKFQSLVREACAELYTKTVTRKAGLRHNELVDSCLVGFETVIELPDYAYDLYKEDPDSEWEVNSRCNIEGGSFYSYGSLIVREPQKTLACRYGAGITLKLLESGI